MPEYRAYILGIDGHRYIRVADFLSDHPDDATAMKAAEKACVMGTTLSYGTAVGWSGGSTMSTAIPSVLSRRKRTYGN